MVVAAGLFLYFLSQGVRYWQSEGDNSSLRDQIETLERATGIIPASVAELEEEFDTKQLQLENLKQKFEYPATDELMSIVSDIAREAGFDLVSMTAEESSNEPRGDLQYRVQPISVVLEGPTAAISDFLTGLYEKVPMVVAHNPRMVNLDTSPSTQLQLRFYLSPEAIPEIEEGA